MQKADSKAIVKMMQTAKMHKNHYHCIFEVQNAFSQLRSESFRHSLQALKSVVFELLFMQNETFSANFHTLYRTSDSLVCGLW